MKNMKRLGITLTILGLIVVGGGLFLTGRHHDALNEKSGSVTASTGQQASFNKQQLSLSDPASLWVIANKTHQLNPATYAPANLVNPAVPLRLAKGNEEMHLRADAAAALEQLVTSADGQGIKLMLASGYRSYNFQVNLYNGYVRQQGQAEADKQSARPGYSEHQTGLAADLEPLSRTCEVEQCFDATPEGKWLAANAYKYGFIIRYLKDKTHVTGYEYEPWHIRYIGTDLSQEMHKQHIGTLEEFFGLPAAPDYH
jgi:D-alanyl-D-alanine carboxypeptidase